MLLDLDGCVWVGEEATPGAAEAIAQLRAAGRRVAFVTNDARHGGEDFVRKLWGLGIQASLRRSSPLAAPCSTCWPSAIRVVEPS